MTAFGRSARLSPASRRPRTAGLNLWGAASASLIRERAEGQLQSEPARRPGVRPNGMVQLRPPLRR